MGTGIQRPGGVNVGAKNPGITVYITGDENTDGSIRFMFTQGDRTTAHLESRENGVWTGIPGDRGAQGDTGAQGLRGAQGETGDKGDTGAQGLRGAQGETGAGDKGETGAGAGAKGDTGAQGETGAQGLRGPTGETGAQGLRGAQGDTGAGDKGDTGAQGLRGAQGDTGAQGLRGAQGETGAGDKGDTGAQGLRGAQGETGAQGPSGPGVFPTIVWLKFIGGNGNRIFATGDKVYGYTDHQQFVFRTNVANSGPVTLNVNGLGPKPIRRIKNQELRHGHFNFDQMVIVIYNFRLGWFEWINHMP